MPVSRKFCQSGTNSHNVIFLFLDEGRLDGGGGGWRIQIPRLTMQSKLLIMGYLRVSCLLLYFSLTVKAATLIFISGCVSAISSAKEGESGFIYDLVKS